MAKTYLNSWFMLIVEKRFGKEHKGATIIPVIIMFISN